ncbi:2OG-Fe dioxygenase family protein [Acidisoma cladoniae]|uniref:2OG-Fe dioxygenase family protein n=1 Tax=Acidisoma cladoniae TaxID=3040935 RepID=UPI00254A4C96|nr:2OG-Fe dioxygenase family protein [Acidisoma sp. PAMC 29798]
MNDPPPQVSTLAGIAQSLGEDGFAQLRSALTRQVLDEAGLTAWPRFAESWNDLGLDQFMADGGRYRRRRFAAFAVSNQGIRRKPHQPHYQSRDYNALNGGIARWFDPVSEGIGAHPTTRAILRLCDSLFTGLTPVDLRPEAWHVEMHQFRIEAQPDQVGQPTPEGLHRDGVDWVLVLLVRRENVASGETTITDLRRQPLSSFTLADPLDAALVDDSRVYHGVTAIHPLDPSRPSFRDVLVITFRRQ